MFLHIASLLLLVAALVSGARAQEAGSGWVVVARSGEVAIIRSGSDEAVPAAVGSLLGTLDRLVTAAGSRAVLAGGNDTLRVNEESEIEIAQPNPEPGVDINILLHKGSVEAKIMRRRDPVKNSFRIETTYLVAAVKGTSYVVRIDPEMVSASVGEGIVRANAVIDKQVDDSQGLDVLPGQTVAVYKDRPGVLVLLGAAGASGDAGAPSPPSSAPSGGQGPQPAGSTPAPGQPAPDQPAPGQPAPDQPAPDQPAPDQPAPVGKAPSGSPGNPPGDNPGWGDGGGGGKTKSK